jgi:TonB family protein
MGICLCSVAQRTSLKGGDNTTIDPGAYPLLKAVIPNYPGIAIFERVEGDVVMHVTIAPDGSVDNIKVVHGLPQLNSAAVHAVSQWKYQPIRSNGVAISSETTVAIHFRFSSDRQSPEVETGTPASHAITHDGTMPIPALRPALPPVPEGAIRISGSVMQGFVQKRVEPVYPPDAVALDARGDVTLVLLISKAGEVKDAEALFGPERFRSAAVDAVKQWRFLPYTKDNDPIEVQTTVKLHFEPPQ